MSQQPCNAGAKASSASRSRRRREQAHRATSRHVAWLTGLVQHARSHHTGNTSAPSQGAPPQDLAEDTLASLTVRLRALEDLVASLSGKLAQANAEQDTFSQDSSARSEPHPPQARHELPHQEHPRAARETRKARVHASVPGGGASRGQVGLTPHSSVSLLQAPPPAPPHPEEPLCDEVEGDDTLDDSESDSAESDLEGIPPQYVGYIKHLLAQAEEDESILRCLAGDAAPGSSRQQLLATARGRLILKARMQVGLAPT